MCLVIWFVNRHFTVCPNPFLMTRFLLFLALLVFAHLTSAQNRYKYPVLPPTGQKIESFVPKGWHIVEKAEDDLNKDNAPDLAAVVEADKDVPNLKEEDYPQKPRILLIAFRQANGSYTLSIQSNESVLLSNEGGMMGDPLVGLTIERSTLLVQFYGGSADRWGYDYRWRFQNNDWFLIGATATFSSMSTNKFNTYDFNLSTGAAEHTSGAFLEEETKKNTPDKKRSFNIGKKPLFKLRSFKPITTQIYKDVYI